MQEMWQDLLWDLLLEVCKDFAKRQGRKNNISQTKSWIKMDLETLRQKVKEKRLRNIKIKEEIKLKEELEEGTIKGLLKKEFKKGISKFFNKKWNQQKLIKYWKN